MQLCLQACAAYNFCSYGCPANHPVSVAQKHFLLEAFAMWVASSLLLCSRQYLCLKCGSPAFAVFLFADSLCTLQQLVRLAMQLGPNRKVNLLVW